MRRHVTTAVLFVAVVLGLAVLAGALLPAAASDTTPAVHAVELSPAMHATDGGAGSLMRRLLGEGADYDAQQAATLVEVAHRICETPGDSSQWIATFTSPVPSPTTGWTVEEATAFVEAAHATFCTWRA